MAEIQIGTAVAWGAPAITSFKTGSTQTAATAATAKSYYITSLQLSKNRSMDETADADGDIVNVTMYGATDEATIEVFPYGSSLANAKTANALPAIGDVLKITPASDTDDADLATAAAGYWSIVSASKSRTNSSKVSFSLGLKRWGGISDVSQYAA